MTTPVTGSTTAPATVEHRTAQAGTRWATPLVVVLALAGALLVLWPTSFQTTATVRAQSAEDVAEVHSRAQALTDPGAVAETLGVDPALARDASIDLAPGPEETLTVTVRHSDPRFAQAVADTVAVGAAGEDAAPGAVELGVLPTDPAGPSRLLLFGAVAGAAALGAAAWQLGGGRWRR